MEFPNRPWNENLDIPAPPWATHQIDFIDLSTESHSVWISSAFYQYFRSTTDAVDSIVMGEPDDSGGWGLDDWEDALIGFPYVKVTDLQPIVENE